MDNETIKTVAELQAENERLRGEALKLDSDLQARDERIEALIGYLSRFHVDPDFLPV